MTRPCAADFVDKIFRGARPADLPVELATKFDLVINFATAKAMGLDFRFFSTHRTHAFLRH